MKQQLLRAGISIPQQSCWLFQELRAASCRERDSTAAPPSPGEVVLGEEGWWPRSSHPAALQLQGHIAPCHAGTAHSTQPCTPVLPQTSGAAQPSSRAMLSKAAGYVFSKSKNRL